MFDTPKSILCELVQGLLHDARLNGSIQTAQPFGTLVLATSPYAPEALWGRLCEQLSSSSLRSAEDTLIREWVKEFLANADHPERSGYPPPFAVSRLSLNETEGSLWKRTLDIFGYGPDMVPEAVDPSILVLLQRISAKM